MMPTDEWEDYADPSDSDAFPDDPDDWQSEAEE